MLIKYESAEITGVAHLFFFTRSPIEVAVLIYFQPWDGPVSP